jgi:hypothetical protein
MDFSKKLQEEGINGIHTWQIESALKTLHSIIRTVTKEDCDVLLSRPIESWIDELCEYNGLAPIEWKDFKVQMFLAMEKEFKKKKEEEECTK